MKHDFDGGKYTVISENGKLTALRNTVPAARWAWCPECRAQPGEACKGSRGQDRKGCHRGRWNAYRDLAQLPVTARA